MFLDTSIIVEIFQSGQEDKMFQEIFEHIEKEPLFVSVFQLGELADWSQRNHIEPEEPIKYVKNMANILPLTEEICLHAADIKHEMRKAGINKFGLADGIILASAEALNQKLLTKDTDYRKSDNAIIIK